MRLFTAAVMVAIVAASLPAASAAERRRDEVRQRRTEQRAELIRQRNIRAYPPAERDPTLPLFVRHTPGGTVTGPEQITYADADGRTLLVVTSRPTTGDGRPDCPAQRLCLYAGPHHEYPRAVTDACGRVDLRTYGWARRTKAVHSNLPGGAPPTGTVSFIRYDPDGKPLGDSNLHTVLTLTPAVRSAVDPVGADSVYHYC